jgi:2'-5' RNA ligase superfamily
MALVVIGYPEWAQQDKDWIESLREEHDKLNFGVVDAHVTFVFPVIDIDEDALVHHVRRQVVRAEPIDLILHSAQVSKDDFIGYWHTFLVPREGYDEVVQLHDKLYMSPLEPGLRRDLPYIPHVSVGTDTDQRSMNRLADELNAQGRAVAGKILEVVVGRYENNAVEPVTAGRLDA